MSDSEDEGPTPLEGLKFQSADGTQPTPEQIQQIQQQFFAEAARRGLTPQEFGEQLKAQAQAQGLAQPQSGGAPGTRMQQQQGGGKQMPIQPGPPKPEAIAVAKFLKSQELKSRPCVLQDKRRDMFKVKRAVRALQSPAYEKARKKKDSLLPPVTDKKTAEETFKLLPMSMLAIRVSRIDPDNNPAHGEPGHQHGATKGKKGVWNVKLEQQQDVEDQYHYVWFYEGAQWQQKLYAGGALLIVVAVVLFPLWPYVLRRGVWYLSMACLGLLGAFFGLAIVRLIFFIFSLAAIPPGIWIYPNLFEDVGFFDSFRPSWAWRETAESLAIKKKEKKEKKRAKRLKAAGKDSHAHSHSHDHSHTHTHSHTHSPNAEAVNGKPNAPSEAPIASKTGTTGAVANEGIAAGMSTVTERRNMQARVEEVDE